MKYVYKVELVRLDDPKSLQIIQSLAHQIATSGYIHCVICDNKISPEHEGVMHALSVNSDGVDETASAVCIPCSNKFHPDDDKLLQEAVRRMCEKNIFVNGRIIKIHPDTGRA